MKEKVVEIKYRECAVAELSPVEFRLRGEAMDAARRAYAPYSRFQVGAAVLLENGEIVSGSNQENAAYPSGLCAERVALFYAGSRYPGVPVVALAVAAFSGGEMREGITPCGSCCQVLVEAEQRGGRPVAIYLCGSERATVLPSVSALLPFAFRSYED